MVRFAFSLPLLLCLAACHHGVQNNDDAARQAIVDYLTKQDINLKAMDLTMGKVNFNGNQADASVSMTLKGVANAMPMNFTYKLEEKDNKWVVVGRANSSHDKEVAPAPGAGGALPPAMPGVENPHGAGGKMPSPGDLPPTKKK